MVSPAVALLMANCMVAKGNAAVPGLALLPIAAVNTSPVKEPSFTNHCVADTSGAEQQRLMARTALQSTCLFITSILISKWREGEDRPFRG
jgi:hypothetical protein